MKKFYSILIQIYWHKPKTQRIFSLTFFFHHPDSTRLSVVHLSPMGSQLSFSNATKIENVVDWEVIAKKYRALMRDEPDEPVNKENEEDAADNVSEVVPNNISAAPP